MKKRGYDFKFIFLFYYLLCYFEDNININNFYLLFILLESILYNYVYF